jgi:hypothetical protein
MADDSQTNAWMTDRHGNYTVKRSSGSDEGSDH